MPIPNIIVFPHDEENDEFNLIKERSKPLIPTIPSLIMNDIDNDTRNSDDSDEDVMTAEEEAAAARRFLNTGASTEQRRLSSLDMYLLQPEVKAEPMIINRRLSLKQEAEDIAQENSEEKQKEEEEKRQARLRQEREEVKKARESKQQNKGKCENSPTTPVRRLNYRKQGLGGMSRERRKKLKEMILLKAKEEIDQERMKELSIREAHIQSVVPTFDIDNLSQNQLQEKIKSWYEHIKGLQIQKIDWELKLRKQDEEISDLTAKLCDMKGHYQKPILRKVRKPMGIVARLDRLRTLNTLQSCKENVVLQKIKERKRDEQNSSQAIRLNGTTESNKTKLN